MWYVFTAFTVAAQLAAAAPVPQELRREELMSALRSGGYTLLVRHARTDRSIPNKESPSYSPQLRADQRNLTAEGERDVRLMAEVVRKYGFPISEVITSPLYRCRETADAFGPASVTMTLRAFPTTSETAALVAATPKPGTNRVLVTHHFVIENHVPGIKLGDIGESEAAVVQPDGSGGVRLVGRITLTDWQALAGELATPPAGASQAPPPAHGAAAAAAHGAAGNRPPGMHGNASPAAIPRTRAGHLAARYIEAFNGGDPAFMRMFIETSLVAVADRPIEARLEGFKALFEQHGPLTVTGVESTSADGLVLQLRSKQGELTMEVVLAPEPSDRAQSITFRMRGAGVHR